MKTAGLESCWEEEGEVDHINYLLMLLSAHDGWFNNLQGTTLHFLNTCLFHVSIDDTSQGVYVPFLLFLALPLSPLLLSFRLLFTKPSFLQFNWVYTDTLPTQHWKNISWDDIWSSTWQMFVFLVFSNYGKIGEFDKLGMLIILHSSLLSRRKNCLYVLLHFRKL